MVFLWSTGEIGGAKESLYEQEPGEPLGFAWLSFGGPKGIRTLDLSDTKFILELFYIYILGFFTFFYIIIIF